MQKKHKQVLWGIGLVGLILILWNGLSTHQSASIEDSLKETPANPSAPLLLVSHPATEAIPFIRDPFIQQVDKRIDISKIQLQLIYFAPKGSRAVINGTSFAEHETLGDFTIEKIDPSSVRLRHVNGETKTIYFL